MWQRDALFIVVSFEGPDPYSQAGGLGVRVSGLIHALADLHHETHLFFIGDPALPGEESTRDGRLVLHRWGQWISQNCPRGVYDGEEGKVADLTSSLPPYVVDRLIVPAIRAGRVPVVLFEEWQTAEAACRVSEALAGAGVRERVLLLWNANNPYGFERIDWRRLAANVSITTISRHMRSIIRACGVDATVIPNGIPGSSLAPVNRRAVSRVRAALTSSAGAGFVFKMARWEREKGWAQTLDAIAHLRRSATSAQSAPILIARSGGPTGHAPGLLREAEARELRARAYDSEGQFLAALTDGLRRDADVVSLRFGVTPSLARTLYAAADGVLANSVSEPFGLVGLEAMAAGGLAFTGGTGEDYAVDGHNAVVLETLDPAELVWRWREITSSPELAGRLRRAARRTARSYEWGRVLRQLLDALYSQGRRQALLPVPTVESVTPAKPAWHRRGTISSAQSQRVS